MIMAQRQRNQAVDRRRLDDSEGFWLEAAATTRLR
jgi:hypothetical protein